MLTSKCGRLLASSCNSLFGSYFAPSRGIRRLPPIKDDEEKMNNTEVVSQSHDTKQQVPAIQDDLKYDLIERGTKKHKVDPKDTTLFLFPGQGSQFVGM